MSRLTSLRRAVLSASVLLAACSGDATHPIAVARVAVSGVAGPNDSLTVGDQRTLVVSLTGSDGAPLTGRPVTWSSSDPRVASVASGAITALAPGQTTISAESEGVRGSVVVSVRRRPVARVTLDRPADTVWMGRVHTLRALPQAADGSTLGDRPVTWTSSDPNVLAVTTASDGTASVRGVAPGTANVVATSEGITTSVSVLVTLVPIARVVAAAPESLLVGRTGALSLTAFAPDNSQLASLDVAGRAVTWTADQPTMGVVNGTGLSATLQALAAGQVSITATLDGVSSVVTVRTVRPAVTRFTFAPPTVSIHAGEGVVATASGYDADGLPVAAAPITYTLGTGSGVVRLTPITSASGTRSVQIDGLSAGNATVIASVDGRSATLDVAVAPAIATLRAFPTSITTVPDNHARLTVTLTDPNGASLATGVLTFTSSNPGVANVDDLGRLTTGVAGTATITVTAPGYTATVPVTVTPPPASTFHIDVRPIGTVPPEILAAAKRAAARWERVITTSPPASPVSLAAGECDLGTPPMNETVPTLVVFLRAQPIDGPRGVLAYAGPCVQRDAIQGGLPLVGAMTVDSGDVALMSGGTAALADDVLAHELGHVLGIGTMWSGQTGIAPLARTVNGELRFTGAKASASAVRTGMAPDLGTGVLIEDQGGLGTAGGHWRERVYLGELMTGYVNAAPNPLSIVTVYALADLGYQVTETGADVVSPLSIVGGPAFAAQLPSSSAVFNRLGGGAPFAIGEKLMTPKFIVKNGVTRRIGAATNRK